MIQRLKVASAEIDDQIVRHMPLKMALEIKRLFLTELGIKYNIIEKGRLKELNKILKKGVIRDQADRELVLNRIDEIYSDKEKDAELNLLNMLLLRFEQNLNKNP